LPICCDLFISSRCILLVDLSLACSLYVSPTYAIHQDLFTDCSGHGRIVLSFDVGDIVAKGTTGLSPSPFSASLFRTTAIANNSAQINQSTHSNSTLHVTCSDAVCASARSSSWTSWLSDTATGRPRGPIALTPDSTVKRPSISTPTASTTTNVPEVETSSPNSVNVLPKPPHSTNDAAPQSKPVSRPEGPPAEPVHISPLRTSAGHYADTPLPMETHRNPSVSVSVIDLGDVQSTQTSPPSSSATMESGYNAVTVIIPQGQAIAHSAGRSAVLQPGTTIPGSQPVSIDKSDQVEAGTSTVNLGSPSNVHDSTIAFGGQNLLPGRPAMTANGVAFSIEPHGGGVVLASEGTTRMVTPGSDGTVQLGEGRQATLTTVPEAIAQRSGMMIAGLTFVPEGPAYVEEDASYSVLPSSSGVVELSSGQSRTLTAQESGILQLGGSNQQATLSAVDTISDRTTLAIAEYTLAPNGEAYVHNGLTISVLPSHSGVLVIEDGQTSIVTSLSGSVFDLGDGQHATLVLAGNSLPVTAAFGHTLSRLPNGNVLVDGTTVTAGSHATTIGDSACSLDPDGRLEISRASSSAENLPTESTNLTVSTTAALNPTTSSTISAVTSDSSINQSSSSMDSGASGLGVSGGVFNFAVGLYGCLLTTLIDQIN
jgi:hypothetical protein